MITVKQFLDSCDVQSLVKFFYYDVDTDERCFVHYKLAMGRYIVSMHCEDDILYVEVDIKI